VTLSLANHDASLPVAYRLYLPEDWVNDQARRCQAKVPETIAFQTKPEIALEQVKAARTAGLPEGVVLMDAGYGNDTKLRTEITALGMSYVAGIGERSRDHRLCARAHRLLQAAEIGRFRRCTAAHALGQDPETRAARAL
jgi:SRSO17 transposase